MRFFCLTKFKKCAKISRIENRKKPPPFDSPSLLLRQ
nr:MAG TPA: hypothetical protein [Caudoviricetes sp.]